MGKLLRLAPLPSIKELLRLYNIKALKHLSQNFLLNLNLTNKLVSKAGNLKGFEVCEIGPGPGSITRSLLMSSAKKIYVIEKDTRFQPILEALQHTAKDKLHVAYADILNYDLSDIFDTSLKKDWKDKPPMIQIIGNLPFSVSDVLIIQFLKDISLRRNAWTYGRVCMTLTFQDEVAQRICSDILSVFRCRLSVMCQNWCKVSYKLKIRGSAFLPKPKVDVGVVHFEPLIEPVIDLEFGMVEKFFRTIFNCRQKHIINTIKHLFPQTLRAALTKELLDMVEFEPNAKSYELTMEEWKQLIMAYKSICDRDPKLYSYNFRGPINTRERDWIECRKVVAN